MAELVTTEEALAYLGIDIADNMVAMNVNRCIKTADSYLKGMIGDNYPIDDPRAKELALIVISDLYDNRGLVTTVTGNTRKLVNDFALQMRLELRRNG